MENTLPHRWTTGAASTNQSRAALEEEGGPQHPPKEEEITNSTANQGAGEGSTTPRRLRPLSSLWAGVALSLSSSSLWAVLLSLFSWVALLSPSSFLGGGAFLPLPFGMALLIPSLLCTVLRSALLHFGLLMTRCCQQLFTISAFIAS